mgnify:CR=1 FL=1
MGEAKAEPVRECVGGCSSDGRAPPLHGGGQGFESPHLHSAGEVDKGSGAGYTAATSLKDNTETYMSEFSAGEKIE